jgi:hypothetical protein
MGKGDFVVRLVGDTKNYSSAMAQAKKSLEGFQQQNLSTNAVMKQITSTLGKYVSAAALVKGAQEAITRTIKGSQTTADAFAATMAAAKTSVNNFFSSLSTGDFTSFNMGLRNIVANAKEAQNAIDRLGNANMSWNYFFGAKQAEFRDYQRVAKDTNQSMSARQSALSGMQSTLGELREYAGGYETRALEAMAREMTKATGISWQDVSRADLEKILRLDLINLGASEAEKERLSAQYAEYQSKAKSIYDRTHTYVPGVVTSYGTTMPYYGQSESQRQEEEAAMRELAKHYQDAILYNEVLVRGSDEWLQNLISLVQQADNARRSMSELDNSVRETANSMKGVTTTALAPSTPVNLGGMYSASIGGGTSSASPSSLSGLPQFYQLQIEQSAIDAIDAMTERTEQLASQAAGINSLANSFQNLGNSLMGGEEKWERVLGVILQIGGAAMSFFGSGGASGILSMIGGMFGGSAMGNGIGSLIGGLSFANGGIVPGSNYYDGITARISSGEMIINEADQKRLFDSIHTGNIGGGGGPARVSGEQIILAINNYGRRTGRGELLFG